MLINTLHDKKIYIAILFNKIIKKAVKLLNIGYIHINLKYLTPKFNTKYLLNLKIHVNFSYIYIQSPTFSIKYEI